MDICCHLRPFEHLRQRKQCGVHLQNQDNYLEAAKRLSLSYPTQVRHWFVVVVSSNGCNNTTIIAAWCVIKMREAAKKKNHVVREGNGRNSQHSPRKKCLRINNKLCYSKTPHFNYAGRQVEFFRHFGVIIFASTCSNIPREWNIGM